MNITKMSAPVGAIVEGLDLRNLDDEQFAEINTLFCEHHVLAFPGQDLTPDDQIAFASRFGELIPFPYMALPDYPNIIELRNKGKKRDVNQHWHSDMTYNQIPPKLTMLYALEAPEIGGETAFSNQELAYQELSDGMRKLIDDLKAHHSAEGLARMAEHIRPGGVFAMWSDGLPLDDFVATLVSVFGEVHAEVVPFENPLQGKTSESTVYIARRGAQ